ncbi:MAG: G-D-S-L family lipolytic protein, partial [Leptolyngbya sp. ERB_1_2]
MQILVPPSIHSIADSATPLRILALGDSIVYGFGDPVGGGWVERLRRRWM